jgi:hypothetical protein
MKTWKLIGLILLGVLAISLSAFLPAVVASAEPKWSTVTDEELAFYRYIEPGINEQYEKTVAELMEVARKRGTLPDSKEQMDKFTEAIQDIFYNKASINAYCGRALKSERAKSKSEADIEAQFKKCLEEEMADAMEFLKLGFEYFDIVAKGSARCEMNARLFRREARLPPYDFLKSGNPHLLDYRALNECLKSPH